jgi:hypothetical protein
MSMLLERVHCLRWKVPWYSLVIGESQFRCSERRTDDRGSGSGVVVGRYGDTTFLHSTATRLWICFIATGSDAARTAFRLTACVPSIGNGPEDLMHPTLSAQYLPHRTVFLFFCVLISTKLRTILSWLAVPPNRNWDNVWNKCSHVGAYAE